MPYDIAGATSLAPAEPHRGQMRFAERFTHHYGGKFLHARGLGWHRYDGTRWAVCDDGAESRAVHTLIKAALKDLLLLDGSDRDALYKDVRKVESATGVAGVLSMARDMKPCAIGGARLDGNGYVLNTPTGTVDMETGEVRDHRPADHLSKVTAAPFIPGARSAVFDAFIERVQPDPDMRAFVARQLGSALLGVIRDHSLFIWTGTGANGKGTLRDAVLHALGDYAVEVPPELLIVSRFAGSKGDADRMALKGARVAFCSEIGRNARMDEPTMKRLTGGDPVSAKLLYENPITFDPTHTLFMLTNHLPQVRGDDPAIWRRIVAVPFDVVIPEEERDGTLPEQLKDCPEAILAWLWNGWLDYQKNGLNPPDSVRKATKQYQLDSDVLARFLADEDAILMGHGSAPSARLYEHFTGWCKAQGEHSDLTQRGFTEAMQRRGFTKRSTKHGALWEGLTIKTADAENDH